MNLDALTELLNSSSDLAAAVREFLRVDHKGDQQRRTQCVARMEMKLADLVDAIAESDNFLDTLRDRKPPSKQD